MSEYRLSDADRQVWRMEDENNSLRQQLAALRSALKPFAEFAEKYAQKPMRQMADTIYAIHVGTEWEAELTHTQMRAASEALRASQYEDEAPNQRGTT